ncbi:MAG: helix-turn-helix domain-containing protein [Proteobacteria bacterium]|nr:helix-turn-helix domain-containing protein [Pseudomonadota bacterium]
MDKADSKKIISELEALKKLTILQLLDRGYTQNQIALTLGVAQQTISKMFPKGVLGKPKNKAE